MPTRAQLLNPDCYAPVLSNAVRIVLILVFAYIATRTVARLLVGLPNYTVEMMLKSGGTEYELENAPRPSRTCRARPSSSSSGSSQSL